MVNNRLRKNTFLREMMNNQLSQINPGRRLSYRDFSRIAKYIENSIFDDDKCCEWNGYVTNSSNSQKGTYINFFFRNKKVALHRLLYENFIGPLSDKHYIKFSCEECEHKGKCCNVNHMVKYKYNTNDNVINKKKSVISKKSDIINDPKNFTIYFD
jgi:hypothetical protein